MPSRDLCQLIESARVGVEGALRALLCDLEPFLLQHAVRLTSKRRLSPDWRHQSASDLLQETRLRIWKGISKFRGAADDDGMENCLRRWVVVVMRRALLDMVEGKRLLREAPPAHDDGDDVRYANFLNLAGTSELPARDPSPSRNLRLSERAVRVHAAISRLAAAEDRSIIEQHFLRGRSLRVIAAEMDMEYTKVRRRFHQALSTLGRELEDV